MKHYHSLCEITPNCFYTLVCVSFPNTTVRELTLFQLLTDTYIIQLLNTYQPIGGKWQLTIVQFSCLWILTSLGSFPRSCGPFMLLLGDTYLCMYFYLWLLLNRRFYSLVRVLCVFWMCRVSCLHSKNLQQIAIKDSLMLVFLLSLWYILLTRSSWYFYVVEIINILFMVYIFCGFFATPFSPDF